MTVLTLDLLPGAIMFLYLGAAIVRWGAFKGTKTFHTKSVLISSICAGLYALSFVWLFVWGDSSTRTAVSRLLSVVSTSVVWVWVPYQAAQRAKIAERVVKDLTPP